MTTHSWHHRFCAECQKYQVHDAGKCIVCADKINILEKLENELKTKELHNKEKEPTVEELQDKLAKLLDKPTS